MSLPWMTDYRGHYPTVYNAEPWILMPGLIYTKVNAARQLQMLKQHVHRPL